MNGRRAKKLRRLARRMAQERMRDLGEPKAEVRIWFRVYLRLAKLRARLGWPVPQERIDQVAKRGVRLIVQPNQGGAQ